MSCDLAADDATFSPGYNDYKFTVSSCQLSAQLETQFILL